MLFRAKCAGKMPGCCWPLPGHCYVVSIHFWFVARHLWMVPWGFWIDTRWLPPNSSLLSLYMVGSHFFFSPTKGIIFISQLFFLGSNELKWNLDSNCMSTFDLFCVFFLPRYFRENIWDGTWFPWREGSGAFPLKTCCVVLLWVITRLLLLYIASCITGSLLQYKSMGFFH